MDSNKLVLAYWPMRGLAQPLRFLLEYLGLPYEDKKYNSHEEWFADKASPPFAGDALANIPYLKDGDKVPKSKRLLSSSSNLEPFPSTSPIRQTRRNC
jgi:hypothetical protein